GDRPHFLLVETWFASYPGEKKIDGGDNVRVIWGKIIRLGAELISVHAGHILCHCGEALAVQIKDRVESRQADGCNQLRGVYRNDDGGSQDAQPIALYVQQVWVVSTCRRVAIFIVAELPHQNFLPLSLKVQWVSTNWLYA